MQTQPTNPRPSEDKVLRTHFTNDLQRDEKGNKATWDLRQWASNITNEENLDQNRFYTDLDASLGLDAYADDKDADHWVKQESECGLLEPCPSPSSSSFTHSSESSDPAPFKFRARANKPLETFTSSNERVQDREIPRQSRLQSQQVMTGPKTKALKRKRDDYEEQSSGYSGDEGWTTTYPGSSNDESSGSRMSVSESESSYSVPSNKRRRSSAFLQPGRYRRSHAETRLPGVKDILRGYEWAQNNEPDDAFIFFWSWLMYDREVVESLSVGL